MLAHEYALLNLRLLDGTLLSHIVDALTVLRGDHTFVLHLLHLLLYALIVSLFELHNLLGTLPRLFNLLPRLHLFLLEEGDTISEKLGVPLHATDIYKHEQVKRFYMTIRRFIRRISRHYPLRKKS